MPGWLWLVLRAAFVASVSAFGLACGFSAGGFGLFGRSGGGHGLAALGDLFFGALVGASAGLVLSIAGLFKLGPSALKRWTLLALAALILVTAAVYVAVDLFHVQAW